MKVKLGLPCGSGVDRHWSWGGSIDTHFESQVGINLRIRGGPTLILGWGEGGQSTLILKVELGLPCRSRADRHSSWGGWSTLTLKVKLGLTCGSGVDQHWSWGGSIDTHFESEVGINLRIQGGSALILGGGGWLTLTLKVKLGLTCGSGVDRHWSWGGVDWHSLWKWSWDYLADLGWIDTHPGGGQLTLTLKVKLGLTCGSGVDRHLSWGGFDWHSLWKWSEVGINLQIWGGSTLRQRQSELHLQSEQHCQRWSFQSLCRFFPGWVSIDPLPKDHKGAVLCGYIIMHYGWYLKLLHTN